MPKMDSQLWSFKCIMNFDSLEDLKIAIANDRTGLLRFVGRSYKSYKPSDVYLFDEEKDILLGWKNYCSVVIDGKTVGFCGE